MFTGYQMQAVGKHYCSIWVIDLSFSLLYFVSFLSYFFNGTTSYSASFISSAIENSLSLTYPRWSIDYPNEIDLIGA